LSSKSNVTLSEGAHSAIVSTVQFRILLQKESMVRLLLTAVCILPFLAPELPAQTSAPSDADLKYVLYLSRHGVRAPTGKNEIYEKFSSAPWPAWEVQPGYLTPHGFQLMELFGAYDRAQLIKEGLFTHEGCTEASKVTFYADSDQRTRETGKALAKGLLPGCDIPIAALSEGINDPLFHLSPADLARLDSAVAAAAIGGRIGNNPDKLTEAYRAQLVTFDKILAECGKPSEKSTKSEKRTSLLDIPAALSAGQGDKLADLRGPINTASTLAENFLLEYTNGMDTANVGWGCVDGPMVRSLIGLHTAAIDITQRTPAIANAQASKLLNQIRLDLEQAVEQHPIPGALGKPTDRALFIVGHDTNLLNMAGTLNLTWIIDGRRDDTPPGGALIFELWKHRTTGAYEVRAYFTVQTLEQMRFAKPLTLEAPPERVPVFIPACSKSNFSCDWPSFSQAIQQATVKAPADKSGAAPSKPGAPSLAR
jgi:4-phytase/acid phosphatase